MLRSCNETVNSIPRAYDVPLSIIPRYIFHFSKRTPLLVLDHAGATYRVRVCLRAFKLAVMTPRN